MRSEYRIEAFKKAKEQGESNKEKQERIEARAQIEKIKEARAQDEKLSKEKLELAKTERNSAQQQALKEVKNPIRHAAAKTSTYISNIEAPNIKFYDLPDIEVPEALRGMKVPSIDLSGLTGKARDTAIKANRVALDAALIKLNILRFGKVKVSLNNKRSLKKMCKRYHIRLTVKRGNKRVSKSEKVLKSQLKNKMKKVKKLK